MKINSIVNSNINKLQKTNKRGFCSAVKNNECNNKNQIAFKSTIGKVAGGALGAAGAGLFTLASMATGGIFAAIALIAAETGGAVIGGAIGDAVTGDDD